MKRFRCHECGNECDLIEEDQGGYEEFWGAKVWHEQFTDITDCCRVEDFDEFEEEPAPMLAHGLGINHE